MKTLFWLIFWLFMTPQALDLIAKKWNVISDNPEIFIIIIPLIIATCWGIIDRLYSERIERLKESNNTLEGRLKARDEEISSLKNKLNNESTENLKRVNDDLRKVNDDLSDKISELEGKINELLKEKQGSSIEKLSNEEIANKTTKLVKDIQETIQTWINFNKEDNGTLYGNESILIHDYEEYRHLTIELKRELSLRLNSDKTNLPKGFYESAMGVTAIIVVCDDLEKLANKIRTKEYL